jgi:hypothetical protein
VENLVNGEPGAIFPIAWALLVALFFAFVIFTSRKFHKHTNPDHFND